MRSIEKVKIIDRNEARKVLTEADCLLIQWKRSQIVFIETHQALLNEITTKYALVLKWSITVGARDYEYQLLGYQRLAEIYRNKKEYVDAVALYNFALGLTEDEEKCKGFQESSPEIYRDQLIQQIKQTEAQFLESIVEKPIPPRDYCLDQAHRDYLKSIRDEARAQLMRHDALENMIFSPPSPVDLSTLIQKEVSQFPRISSQDVYNNIDETLLSLHQKSRELLQSCQVSIQDIYRYTSKALRRFIRVLLLECQQILEDSGWEIQKPSEENYAIVCFGSLARDEATPYSDLEFGILLSDIADTENTKIYFRVLTKLLNIKVLNLGETPPRFHEIKELKAIGLCGRYSESPNKPGWSFDGNNAGGRKTPLGNQPYDDVLEGHRYELIGTPESIAELHNEDWYQKDKHLSTVLMTARLIVGNKALLKRYEYKKQFILNETIDGLTKKSEESLQAQLSSSKTRIQRRSLDWLKESVEEYQFRGGRFEKEGHFFDAKYNLYRLPNMLIDHLASYFNVVGYSLWERIENLFGDKGILPNAIGKLNLYQCISRILEIRLRLYLKRDCRDNHVVMFDPADPRKNQQMLQKYLSLSQENLFQIYGTLIPLQWIIQGFIAENASEGLLLKSTYYSSRSFIKGYIYELLLDYENAARSYEVAKDIYMPLLGPKHIVKAIVLNNLGNIYRRQSKYREAAKMYEEVRDTYEHGHIFIADTMNDLGMVYRLQGRYPEAIAAYEEAERIKTIKQGPEHVSLVNILNNLGVAYQQQSDYSRAITLYERSQRIAVAAYGPQHISIVDMLNNLGNVYQLQSRHSEAISLYEKALRIIIATYGAGHIFAADTLHNIGNSYALQSKFSEAIDAHEESKRIKISIYGLSDISIADILNSLALIAVEQKFFEEARSLFQQARNIYIQFAHPHQAGMKANISLSYLREGNFYLLEEEMNIEKAKICYQQSSADLGPFAVKTHEYFSEKYYKSNNLFACIEHCRILIRFNPRNASVHHKLGCLFHVCAQIGKDKKEDVGYKAYLEKSRFHFERAICLGPSAYIYTEYAQFLWKNREEFSAQFIISVSFTIAMLKKAIELKQMDKVLCYCLIVRPTVDIDLQRLIDKEKEISLEGFFLAHYLLIQIYCFYRKLKEARDFYKSFKEARNKYSEESLEQQNPLVFQMGSLIAASLKQPSMNAVVKEGISEIKKKKLYLLRSLLFFSKTTIKNLEVAQMHEKLMEEINVYIGKRKKHFLRLLEDLENHQYSKALRMICNFNKIKNAALGLAKILLKYRDSLSICINEQAGDMKRAAIHYVALHGNQTLYDFLIEHQADVTLVDKDGICAEEYMNRHQNPEKSEFFCNHK